MREIKYLGILFMSNGKEEHALDQLIGASSAFMGALNWTVVVETQALIQKANLSIYQPIHVSSLHSVYLWL